MSALRLSLLALFLAAVTLSPSTAEAGLPFSCANAAEALGHPDLTVRYCRPAAQLPGLYSVLLETTAGKTALHRIVAVSADGHVITERGPAAAAKFLRQSGAITNPDVTGDQVYLLLRGFESLPQLFSAGFGEVGMATDPFRFSLTINVTEHPGPPLWRRASLAVGEAGRLVWTWSSAADPNEEWWVDRTESFE